MLFKARKVVSTKGWYRNISPACSLKANLVFTNTNSTHGEIRYLW